MPARVVYGCTDNSTTTGTTYYYKVKAVKIVNGKNISSAYINTVSVTAKWKTAVCIMQTAVFAIYQSSSIISSISASVSRIPSRAS